MGPENNGILGNPSVCDCACCPTYCGPSGGPKTTDMIDPGEADNLLIYDFLNNAQVFKWMQNCWFGKF